MNAKHSVSEAKLSVSEAKQAGEVFNRHTLQRGEGALVGGIPKQPATIGGIACILIMYSYRLPLLCVRSTDQEILDPQ